MPSSRVVARTAALGVFLLACLSVPFGVPAVRAGPGPADDAITVELVPATTYVACDRVGPYADLAADYPRLSAFMRATSLAASGPAEGLYFDDPANVRADRLRSTACFPVASPLPVSLPAAAAEISVRPLPARLVARTIHVGPYAEVRPTYERLRRALPSLGLRYVGPMREVYLNDPASTQAANLRTEVCLVVEPTAKTDVGLYVGPGADAPGLRALSQMLFAAGITFRPLSADAMRAGGIAAACRAVVVPGGWAPDANAALGERGVGELRAFVRGGGAYVGVCAGAYLASRTVVWEGQAYAYPLGLLDGLATGPIQAIAPWPARVPTHVLLEGSHPIVAGLRGPLRVPYQGGPAFTAERGDVDVLARFASGGGAALIAFVTGKGRVVLSSVHLEGSPDEAAGPAAPTQGPARAEERGGRELLARALRWALFKPPVK